MVLPAGGGGRGRAAEAHPRPEPRKPANRLRLCRTSRRMPAAAHARVPSKLLRLVPASAVRHPRATTGRACHWHPGCNPAPVGRPIAACPKRRKNLLDESRYQRSIHSSNPCLCKPPRDDEPLALPTPIFIHESFTQESIRLNRITSNPCRIQPREEASSTNDRWDAEPLKTLAGHKQNVARPLLVRYYIITREITRICARGRDWFCGVHPDAARNCWRQAGIPAGGC